MQDEPPPGEIDCVGTIPEVTSAGETETKTNKLGDTEDATRSISDQGDNKTEEPSGWKKYGGDTTIHLEWDLPADAKCEGNMRAYHRTTELEEEVDHGYEETKNLESEEGLLFQTSRHESAGKN
ncbi:hypothetical protein DFH06DRAFT_1124029 [Mycena polygramma]|nr:hypothetical protein DFH06DRAFT_1124029 [Mycena polygramma]